MSKKWFCRLLKSARLINGIHNMHNIKIPTLACNAREIHQGYRYFFEWTLAVVFPIYCCRKTSHGLCEILSKHANVLKTSLEKIFINICSILSFELRHLDMWRPIKKSNSDLPSCYLNSEDSHEDKVPLFYRHTQYLIWSHTLQSTGTFSRDLSRGISRGHL